MKPLLKAVVLTGCLLAGQPVWADKIDDFVREEMQRKQIPAVVVGVMHRGKEVKLDAYGSANIELNTPATTDSAFEIGSITTEFTAAAIMLLQQDGKLSLDDPISLYLKGTPASWNKITIRHLLGSTSGIKSYAMIKEGGFELTKRLTQDQFIQKLGKYPLDFAPGEKSLYSVSSYSLLGYIVENVSGKDYWTFLNDRIFRPLGMKSSGDREPRVVIANRADGYEKDKNGAWVNRDFDLTDMFSAGAMISSVPDLLKWDAALDSEMILLSSSKKKMWTPSTLNKGHETDFGFGCRIVPDKPFYYLSRTGATSGFSSSYLRYPEIGLGIVVASNLGEANIAHTIAKRIAGFYINGN